MPQGLKADTAVQAVIGHIRSGVEGNILCGGQRIPNEEQISKAVGVSRGPVREALKILEAMGVLEIRRGIGTYVRPQGALALNYLVAFQDRIATASPRQLFETRLMIERTASEYAAVRRTDADLAAMRQANRRLEELSTATVVDLDAMTRADVAFHHAVFDSCGNDLVAMIGKFITELVAPLMREGHARTGGMRAVRNHDLIITMIARRDASGASEAAHAQPVHDGLEEWQEVLEKPANATPQAEESKA